MLCGDYSSSVFFSILSVYMKKFLKLYFTIVYRIFQIIVNDIRLVPVKIDYCVNIFIQ